MGPATLQGKLFHAYSNRNAATWAHWHTQGELALDTSKYVLNDNKR
jgi:hypothetical protein